MGKTGITWRRPIMMFPAEAITQYMMIGMTRKSVETKEVLRRRIAPQNPARRAKSVTTGVFTRNANGKYHHQPTEDLMPHAKAVRDWAFSNIYQNPCR